MRNLINVKTGTAQPRDYLIRHSVNEAIMARIFNFPQSDRIRQRGTQAARSSAQPVPEWRQRWNAMYRNPVFLVLASVVLAVFLFTGPLLLWLVGADLVFQLLRTLVLWNTPGAHAGLTCLLHFAVVAFCVLVVVLAPPDFKLPPDDSRRQ
jgi:hypothetical protein